MSCYNAFHVTIPGRLESVPVPCGKCPYCLKRKVSSWAFRLRKEDERSAVSFFVTLTYAEIEHFTPRGFMNLNKRDVQLFFKRLRKATSGTIWKYYAVGEYGSENWRPHYHIILFASTRWTKQQLEIQLYKSWEKGKIDVGTVTGASVAYTLKYVQKPARVPVHVNDDRLPEFSLMSKGLGENFITDETKHFYRENLSENYVIQDGFKIPMPRFYRERIFSRDDKGKQRQIIRKSVKEREILQSRRYYDLHPASLQVDYETYKNENRMAAYRSFFKNQSLRKL